MANRSPEPLGDFVRRIRNKKGFSLTDVAKQSGRFGPSIAASYVSRIENDPTRKPTAVALKALAYGLGVPPEELLARAVGLFEPGGKSEELQLLSRFKELSPEKRDIVLDIVDMLYSKESRRTPKRKPA
jgi:transcriptional regulator with XRE-family HTH domain